MLIRSTWDAVSRNFSLRTELDRAERYRSLLARRVTSTSRTGRRAEVPSQYTGDRRRFRRSGRRHVLHEPLKRLAEILRITRHDDGPLCRVSRFGADHLVTGPSVPDRAASESASIAFSALDLASASRRAMRSANTVSTSSEQTWYDTIGRILT